MQRKPEKLRNRLELQRMPAELRNKRRLELQKRPVY